jgi:hypothetical protein
VQSWGTAAPAAIAATASGRRCNAYCRSVGAGGMTACVLAPSAAVPQPGRDSINGDVDSLHARGATLKLKDDFCATRTTIRSADRLVQPSPWRQRINEIGA